MRLGLAVQPASDHLNDPLIVNRERVVDDQHFRILILLIEPLLVLVVNPLQVIQRNTVFSFSAAFEDAFLAGFGRALDVDDSEEVDDLAHADQVVVELQVDGVLGLVEDSHVLHDAGEDEAVGQQGALGNADSFAGHLAVLRPLGQSAHESEYLEGKAPSLGLSVVKSQEIDVLLLPDVLPFSERLVEYAQLREVFPDDFQNGGLTAADVALNGDKTRLCVCHFWRHPAIFNLESQREASNLTGRAVFNCISLLEGRRWKRYRG